ncbi:PREDICTED: uncharacterized protein LOC104606454 isoform X1 [Nelumbo nucifera]|uniref:Uncharacterized protein LOC104606454 isoform X1 n=2 Tax=Nelumbo nucifera TaxID=4432 RepID=A0A1U8AQN0_NELNU|nr:PREDICTED: uncharacterized protein LOC104606454 isoform X1 [Nelumbo nucifera]DAD47532.1 TPA_asm: hypothetical protein HUJ06_017469 [Nelumbo nucifera]
MAENSEKTDSRDEVEIVLKTVGPARPSRIKVPSSIKVQDLRNLIAKDGHLPVDHLKLILRGETLHDKKNGDDVQLQLKDGGCAHLPYSMELGHLVMWTRWSFYKETSHYWCMQRQIKAMTREAGIRLFNGFTDQLTDSLIVAVKPKSPVKRNDGFDDDDDDDDLKFQIPESSSWWKKRLFSFLHDKLKLPCILLMAIFSMSQKAWVFIILWFILAPIAYRLDIGPLYILGTGFSIVFLNLGQRQHGELSAYSIFNEDFRELPGTLNADRLDRDIRTGQL